MTDTDKTYMCPKCNGYEVETTLLGIFSGRDTNKANCLSCRYIGEAETFLTYADIKDDRELDLLKQCHLVSELPNPLIPKGKYRLIGGCPECHRDLIVIQGGACLCVSYTYTDNPTDCGYIIVGG